MRHLLYFIFAFTCLTNCCFASPPTIQRVSPFQISQLDSLVFDELRGDTLNQKEIIYPAKVAWTHRLINDTNKSSVFLWDSFSNVLIAWFLEKNGQLYDFVGSDTLEFGEHHFYKGAVQLEEPLVAPNNIETPDSSVTEFTCLDKSFAKLRRIKVNWDNRDIAIDTCTFPHIGYRGGFPEHSFYTTGISDSTRSGIIFYRKIMDDYAYRSDDLDFYEEAYYRFFKNQYEDLPYSISDIVGLATGQVTDLFLVIDLEARFIYRNRIGLSFSPQEWKKSKLPSCSPPYPAHLFTEELNKNQIIPQPLPWEDNPYAIVKDKHIEVDCDGQIWYNGLRSDKICLIKDAFFDFSISDFSDSDTTYVIDLPKLLPSRAAGIKDIDGSVKGYLTITYFNGIETYKVAY